MSKDKLRTVKLENMTTEFNTNERKLLKPITVTCTDCHKPFIITPDEQAFFNQKQFDLPKRCKPCRVIRRQNNLSIQKI